MNTYIAELNGQWYAYGADHDRDLVIDLRNDKNTAPWSAENIAAIGSLSPSRSAAYQKAVRHGTYIGREF